MSKTLDIYQVDAFTSEVFKGNPAAVVPLQDWLPDTVMAAIAAENNLPETAFFVPRGNGYHLRWFTPASEVELCGHATLASAFVLMSELQPGRTEVAFDSLSGELRVTRHGDAYKLDFPAAPPQSAPLPASLDAAIGVVAETYFTGLMDMAVLADAGAVRRVSPDFEAVCQLNDFGLIITAPGDEAGVDFVSRVFAPNHGIPEDPVTGSAHTVLAPYWAGHLGKTTLRARQVSARGGELLCEWAEESARVYISGEAVLYLRGEIRIP